MENRIKQQKSKGPKSEKCQLILIKGKNKNQLCNKPIFDKELCKTHFTQRQNFPYNPYKDSEFDVILSDGLYKSTFCSLDAKRIFVN